MIGALASSTTLRAALFLIPVLTATVAVGTWTAKGIRCSPLPADAASSAQTSEPVIRASRIEPLSN